MEMGKDLKWTITLVGGPFDSEKAVTERLPVEYCVVNDTGGYYNLAIYVPNGTSMTRSDMAELARHGEVEFRFKGFRH
jgi:hypothetical protein